MTLTLLGWVYFFSFLLGLGFVLISFLLGEVSAAHGAFGHANAHGLGHVQDSAAHPAGGKDTASSDGANDYPVFSPLNIALAMTSFGGVGTILNILALPGYVTFPGAAVAGAAMWGATFYFFFRLFRATQGSSEAVVDQLVGKEASVTVSIPANGLGEIRFVARGSGYNAPARLEDGSALAQGSSVIITRIDDGVYVVKASVDERLKQL
jgi:hypothetical protein